MMTTGQVMLFATFFLLGMTGIARADCSSDPCTVPMMTVTDTPNEHLPPAVQVECPKYVILNGTRLSFDRTNRDEINGTVDCVYNNSDVSIYVAIRGNPK